MDLDEKNLLSEEKAKYLMQQINANPSAHIGVSDEDKPGCYWSIYKIFGKYYIGLADYNDHLYEVDEETANAYNDNPF